MKIPWNKHASHKLEEDSTRSWNLSADTGDIITGRVQKQREVWKVNRRSEKKIWESEEKNKEIKKNEKKKNLVRRRKYTENQCHLQVLNHGHLSKN